MKQSINYFNHKTYDPSYYHRQYENDLKENKKDSEDSKLHRAFLISMPFISLHKPFGAVISSTTGALRIFSNLKVTCSAENKEDFINAGGQTVLATIAFAGNYFNFILGLYITTALDITSNTSELIHHLSSGDMDLAFEQLLQGINSCLYLSIMMTGSLEITLASLLVQTACLAYQAKKEWNKDRMPEAIAKSLMGFIRMHQASKQVSNIRRKNFLYSLKKYEKVIENIQRGKKADHLLNSSLSSDKSFHLPAAVATIGDTSHLVDHPLTGLASKIEDHRLIYVDAYGKEYDFGANFHGNGKDLVKGMNICFKTKGEMTQLDFKVNHVHRKHLQNLIDDATNNYSKQEVLDILSLSGSRVKDITFTEQKLSFDEHGAMGDGYQIDFHGLGKVFIGASTENYNQYDRVCIQMNKGKNLFDFHEILSHLELDKALKQSSQEDIERMKIGHLFRIFCPAEATSFERTEAFFNLPISDLKQNIISQAPDMKKTFNNYLSKMELREIMPGKMRFAVNGLAKDLEKQGAYGLTSAIFGCDNDDDKQLFDRVDMILRMGMLSSETRYTNGVSTDGLSGDNDFITGGADSVFTQMVNRGIKSFDELDYNGEVRLLFSLKALENGSYQYHYDNYGNRLTSEADLPSWLQAYEQRPGITDFVKEEVKWPTIKLLPEDLPWLLNFDIDEYEYAGNEVMIKERIGTEFITGIVVDNKKMKKDLINHLKKTGICKKNKKGQQTILGKPVNKFIHVGDKVSKSFFQ